MRVAIGFSIHTGWAFAVALSGAPALLARQRFELADREHDARFVYHAAAEAPARASKLIAAAQRTAAVRAQAQLTALAKLLGAHEFVVAVAAPKRALPALEQILLAHPLLHRAEGELYRGAIVEAAAALGLAVATPQPGPVPPVGKPKPPWGKDQKDAAALAWAALQGGR